VSDKHTLNVDRMRKCQQFQNDLDESVRKVIEQHKPTYSELFFALLSVHRCWADMMMEDENDGVNVRPVQETPQPIIRRRRRIINE